MLIALSAISVFSFTQAFDRSVVMAVGGLDDCNGSDITNPIDCEQLPGSGGTCDPNSQYKKVENGQAYKDQISESKTECVGNGCKNIPNNPSPKVNQACKKNLVEIPIDPE
jgi:hypothetical protein